MADEQNQGKGTGGLGDLVKAESMVQLALAVPGGVVVGLLIGGGLDHHFHAHWMVIVGMLLGATAGFIQIFQFAARSGRDGR